MDRFSNINTQDNITSALFNSTDIAEANLLKRAILSEINTYAIDIVIFHTNTTARHDEIIALRLGQLPIDHSRFNPINESDFTTRVDFSGPGKFTTQHIPNIPFKYIIPIMELREGQRIICDVIIKEGKGKTHVKWRPVSTVTLKEVQDGILITFKEVGMLSPVQILQLGLQEIKAAATRPEQTLFSRPLIPVNL